MDVQQRMMPHAEAWIHMGVQSIIFCQHLFIEKKWSWKNVLKNSFDFLCKNVIQWKERRTKHSRLIESSVEKLKIAVKRLQILGFFGKLPEKLRIL